MTKTEARQHLGSVHIYWHGKDHCWDATRTRRHHLIDKAQQKIDQPKWHEAMPEMLPDQEPLQTPWVDRWVNIEPPQLAIVARGVDIVQVAPPPIIEREPEPMATPPRRGDGDHHHGTDACDCRSSVRRHDLSTSSIKKKYTIGCILEEDLVPELRSPLNVYDGVLGAGNYWEKIQDAMEMADRIIRKPGLFDSRPWSSGADCQKTTATAAANPRLKTEDRPVICARYKSSLNGDFNDFCNKTSGPFVRFDCLLRFKYRAIPANA
jgi:hypothetical protein